MDPYSPISKPTRSGACPKCNAPAYDGPEGRICSACPWSEKGELDGIKNYVDQAFPIGVDPKAAAARTKSSSLKEMAEAIAAENQRENEKWLHKHPAPPLPTAVAKEMGVWKSLGFEQGNHINIETQVMAVFGGCILRTIIDSQDSRGGPPASSSMVFVPNADIKVFQVKQETK